MMNEAKDLLLKTANLIEYETLSDTCIAKNYIKYKEENNRLADSYYAALIIKNWGTIFKLKSSVSFSLLISIEDCYDWLIDGINIVLKYKKWEDENSELYQEDSAFDRMLTITLSHIRCSAIRKLYQDKNINNNFLQSLDFLNETIKFEPSTTDTQIGDIYKLINHFLDEGDYIKAIVIDKICFSDVFSINKNNNLVLSSMKLYKQLHEIDERYYNYFKNRYNWEDTKYLDRTIKKLNKKSTNNFIINIKENIKDIKKAFTKMCF